MSHENMEILRRNWALEDQGAAVQALRREVARLEQALSKEQAASAVEQDGRDLDEARHWVSGRIELGAPLPPLEVAYMAGLRSGRARGESVTATAIAELLEAQAEKWAPQQAAVWLLGMAKTIRRGEWRE